MRGNAFGLLLAPVVLAAMQTPRDLQLEWERIEPQTAAGSKRWALVAGISGYKNLPGPAQLRYAHKDAEEFARFLRSPQAGALGAAQVRLLTEQRATIGALRSALQEWLPMAAGPRDVVYIYFAGHGVIGERNEPYFLGHDSDPQNLHATALSFRELNEAIATRIRAQAVILIADACHAGEVGWAASNSAPLAGAALESLAVPDRMFFKLLASRSTERSYEDARWGGGHGVFTYSLLRGLQGEADRERDGFVRVSELAEFVGKEVNEQTGGRQNPRVAGNFEPRMALAAVGRGTAVARDAATLEVVGPAGTPIYVDDVFRGVIRPAGRLTVDTLTVGAHKLAADLAIGYTVEQPLAIGANTTIDIGRLPGVAYARLLDHLAGGRMEEGLELFRGESWDGQYKAAATAAVATALEDQGQACVNDYVQSDSIALKRPMLARAVGAYRMLQKIRPGDRSLQAKIHFCEARGQIAAGEFEAAEKNLRASIAIENNFACSYNALGVALGRMGRSAEARAAFDKAGELTPQWGLPFFQIGQTLLNAGQAGPALAYLEKAVKLYPRSNLARWTLLRAYRLAGQAGEFERTAQEMMAADANYAPVYLELGEYFEARKDFARAAQAFDAYLLLAPNFSDSGQVRQRAQRSRSLTGRQAPSLLKKK
ncbi:MAG: caspase family protein [Bryobacterales bacterium]|nr:caspase family protein [Bryobacterales bacterium]